MELRNRDTACLCPKCWSADHYFSMSKEQWDITCAKCGHKTTVPPDGRWGPPNKDTIIVHPNGDSTTGREVLKDRLRSVAKMLREAAADIRAKRMR